MRISYLSFLLWITALWPYTIFAQDWNSAIENINENRNEISGISYHHPGTYEGEHVDSIFIKNNGNYDKVVIELYYTLVKPNDPIEYVTAMDLPIINLVGVSKFEGELKLSFSNDCKKTAEPASEYLLMYFSSEKDYYVTHAAFKHLKYSSMEYHTRKHDAEVCELGKSRP